MVTLIRHHIVEHFSCHFSQKPPPQIAALHAKGHVPPSVLNFRPQSRLHVRSRTVNVLLLLPDRHQDELRRPPKIRPAPALCVNITFSNCLEASQQVTWDIQTQRALTI